ncbi:hypothetical protein GGX14DRAFT_298508, partial [Mycena pura]
LHSFLVPYDDELALLAQGVPTFDSLTGEIFDLHAYNIFGMGDILAVQKLLNIKGVNSKCGCRSCGIMGFQNLSGEKYNYYYPLTAPTDIDDPRAGRSWDPANFPLRNEETFRSQLTEISQAHNTTRENELAKHYGLNGPPALRRVESMQRGRSYPWDFMHLLFENIIQNLVMLWSGTFKGLSVGTGNYELHPGIVDEVWAETADATKTISSAFVRSFAGGKGKFTAESWSFWFVYVAPGVLQGRLHIVYHKHACDLGVIIKRCLKFGITMDEIDDLKRKIIDWVREYERQVL